MRISKAEYRRRAKKAAATKKENKLKQKHHRAAKKASRKNILSEDKFVDRLRRKGFFAFKTGKAEGPPDIVAYKNRKLSFYEIKPAFSNTGRRCLLKLTQSDWIKKYCLKKKIEVNIVFYKGSRPFKYSIVRLNKKNISRFVNNQKNRDDIVIRTNYFLYS